MEFVNSVYYKVIAGFRLVFTTLGFAEKYVDNNHELVAFLAKKSYIVGITSLVFGFGILIWTYVRRRSSKEDAPRVSQIPVAAVRSEILREVAQDAEEQRLELEAFNRNRRREFAGIKITTVLRNYYATGSTPLERPYKQPVWDIISHRPTTAETVTNPSESREPGPCRRSRRRNATNSE